MGLMDTIKGWFGKAKDVAASAVHAGFHQTDSTIDNARPDIGLAADPVRLASDAEVRGHLLGDAASQAADRILAAVLGDRAAEVRQRVDALTRQGKDADAVDIDLLVEMVLSRIPPMRVTTTDPYTGEDTASVLISPGDELRLLNELRLKD